MTAALRDVSVRTGHRIQARARALLLEKTRSDKTPASQATKTAEAIKVTVDEVQKAVYVTSAGVAQDPANNPLWLEHGTVHQGAKAYMRPARLENEDAWRRDMAAAADGAVRKALT